MSREQTATRDRADELDIKYHHNASDETIQRLIDAHEAENDPNQMAEGVLSKDECQPLSAAEFTKKYRNGGASRKEVGQLVRCRIQCMDPKKKEWPGEIISVGSAKLGTFKKYVPYNSPEPWHIPKIIYDMLLERKCTIWYTDTDERGHKTRKGRQVNAYNIEVLDPLTPDELEELARRQAMRAGQG